MILFEQNKKLGNFYKIGSTLDDGRGNNYVIVLFKKGNVLLNNGTELINAKTTHGIDRLRHRLVYFTITGKTKEDNLLLFLKYI